MHLLALIALLPILASAQSGQTCSNKPDRPYCDRYCDGDGNGCGSAVYNCIDGKTQVSVACGDCECIDQRTEAMCDPNCINYPTHKEGNPPPSKRTAVPGGEMGYGYLKEGILMGRDDPGYPTGPPSQNPPRMAKRTAVPGEM